MSDYESNNESESSESDSEEETTINSVMKKNSIVDVAGKYEEGDEDVVEDDDLDDDEDVEDDDDEEVEDDDDDDERDESLYQQEIEGEAKESKESKKAKKTTTSGSEEQKKARGKTDYESNSDGDDDDEETDEHYLQKFDIDINKNYLLEVHPECLHHNYDEIAALTVIVRDSDNIIIDPLHRTIPFLTKYERARILGQRAKQINMGAQAFITIPENVIDGIVIAELELRQKKIPFIIKRPLPNGACEYWNVNDLENILY